MTSVRRVSPGPSSSSGFVSDRLFNLEQLVVDLRGILGDRVSTGASQREHHSHGESWHTPALPDVVVFPQTTDEVAAVVRAAEAASFGLFDEFAAADTDFGSIFKEWKVFRDAIQPWHRLAELAMMSYQSKISA